MCQSGTINIGLRDHLLTYCTRKVVRGQVGHHNVIKIRSLKKYSKETLLSKLTSSNWSSIYECINVNQAWNVLKTTFFKILDEIAPIKEIRLKSRTEPWMDNDILEDIRTRDKLMYGFKKDRTNGELYTQYCKMRNKVERDIKKAKILYFSTKIEEHKNKLKSLGYI